MPRTYSEKMTRRAVIFVVVTLVAAFIAKALMRLWGVNDGGWIAFGLMLSAFAVFFVLAVKFWQSLDDMQRQGQAWSWYWGSIVSTAIIGCWIAGAGLGKSDFTKGVGTLLILQLGCSLLLQGFWWLKGRSFSFWSGE